jgi:hypothetical protein
MSTIVTRAGKGSALTYDEVDSNFINLNTDKIQAGDTVSGLTLTSPVITGSTANPALRITQTGTGNALVVEDSTNPDATPFVIDPNGNVLRGYTSRITAVTVTPAFQAFGQMVGGASNASGAWFGGFNYTNDTVCGGLVFGKSRGTSPNTQTILSNGDTMGNIVFSGSDGTDFRRAAAITSSVDGVPSSNSVPGNIRLSTTAVGENNPTTRRIIDSGGDVGIGTTTPNASALLDVQSTTKGVRMPNMTTAERNAIESPAAGLMVFDTTLAKLCVYNGTNWQTITSV